MRRLHNVTLSDLDKYLKKIFDLENQLLDKDFKISLLKFELAMEKSLIEAFKHSVQVSNSLSLK